MSLQGRGVRVGPTGRPIDFVEKERVTVLVYTTLFEIRGTIHYAAGQRTTDVLNHGDQFLAVTDAVVTPLFEGQAPSKVDYIAVNREQIVAVIEERRPF